MKKIKTMIIVLLLLMFVCGSFIAVIALLENMKNNPFAKKTSDYSIKSIQDYNINLCAGVSSVHEGYDGIGIKLQPYDSESNELINAENFDGFVNFPKQGAGSSVSSKDFTCYISDPTFYFSVNINAKDYISVKDLAINPVAVGKMYLIKVPMHKKPACYYDKENLQTFSEYINNNFGLDSTKYSLTCMDSSISRGGFVKSSGKYNDGGSFEVFYRWGSCSSGGADCGHSSCFAVEGNDNLFQTVKTKLCNDLYSYNHVYPVRCTEGVDYDNTEEIRKKCMAGEYDYVSGNKQVISIIQDGNACSASVKKGNLDCLGIN
ncbi:MAG: hypothetical protein WC755_00110 [Candidatus Woesearchaeota archaeon]|jgi:hypothetical protein